MDRKVWLPSGGTLVIDRTEAMTVVDVNTGKFTGSGGNLEQTVTKNNLEAAEEIVRQLRLRDIGGIVVIDFIDMVLESNRDLVLRRLTEALARDRTRHQVSEVTSLGLVQLTRKRLGTGLIEAFSTTCPHCGGRGHPAARRSRRLGVRRRPQVRVRRRGAASASQEGQRRRGRRRSRRCPRIAPASIRCSRRWPPPTARHEDDDEPDEDAKDEDDKAAEEVAEVDADTIKKAVVDTADEDLEDDDLDDDDDSTTTTTTTRTTTTTTTTIDDEDDDDDDLDDDDRGRSTTTTTTTR